MKLTEEQIAELKKKHGDLYEIRVGEKSCIVRKPKRKDLSYVSVVKDPIKRRETLLRQTWVEGDAAMIDDDEYFIPAMSRLDELMIYGDAEIKKL